MITSFKIIGKLLNYLLIILIFVIFLSNLYLFTAKKVFNEPYPMFFGFTNAIVVSGSMSPTIQIYDMVMVQRKASYETGDIISYKSGKNLVTHRIRDIGSEGFITRGDYNNTDDQIQVSQSDVIGKVVLKIPYVGIVKGYLMTPIGAFALILAGTILIGTPFLTGQKNEKK